MIHNMMAESHILHQKKFLKVIVTNKAPKLSISWNLGEAISDFNNCAYSAKWV